MESSLYNVWKNPDFNLKYIFSRFRKMPAVSPENGIFPACQGLADENLHKQFAGIPGLLSCEKSNHRPSEICNCYNSL